MMDVSVPSPRGGSLHPVLSPWRGWRVTRPRGVSGALTGVASSSPHETEVGISSIAEQPLGLPQAP